MEENQSFAAVGKSVNHKDAKGTAGSVLERSPLRLLLIIVAGIAIAETIAMIVVYFYRFLPYHKQMLLDAVVMVIIIFPFLYLLSTKPLLHQLQQRAQTEHILQIRLKLMQYAGLHSLDELLQFTLDQMEELTGSTIGYLHFLDANQKTLWLRSWSTNTLQNMCTLTDMNDHYDVDEDGVWSDCVRAMRPVIHNDYALLSHRRGLPDGHAPVLREMAVPILRDGKIVAILGIGNKPKDYTPNDVELVSTLADFAWEQIMHKQAGDELLKSEEKFRTLVDWTYDWEFWLDPLGKLVYISPSCKRITGFSPQEFANDPELMMSIVHPKDKLIVEDHLRLIHSESAGVEKMEYRITTRDGKECWIEHICRPLFTPDNQYLGRRISNRDITERKLAETMIDERNQKEKLLTQTIHTMQLDIARDLHDTLGQNISFLRMKLNYLAEGKPRKQAEMQSELQGMARAANDSYDLIRGTLAVLQSENSKDLFHLFTRYAEQVEERSPFQIRFFSSGETRFIPARRIRQLFYIFREILNNIEKHANATEVAMELTWDHRCLQFVVSDNGCGFDLNQLQFGKHYGLKFMRERVELLNGSLSIQTNAGAGTKIQIQVPYE